MYVCMINQTFRIMKRLILLIPVFIVSLFILPGCEEEKTEAKSPIIKTLSAESEEKGVTYIVSLTGCISGLEAIALDFECGIEYSTDASFSKDKTTRLRANNEYSEDPYTVNIINGVTSGQKYYYRAYYINQLMLYYGGVKDFTFTWQVAQNGSENGYEYIELGLNVRWASYNVGATKPEEYGDYFAWGETETRGGYLWGNYKWGFAYNDLNKYNVNSTYGTVDNKTTLDPEDDVAHVKWGGSWRMPTMEEQEELRRNCTWVWYSSDNTEFNGIAGYKVISNMNGYTDRFIFLPTAGWLGEPSIIDVSTRGSYWSSSLETDFPGGAHSIMFNSKNVVISSEDRSLGLPVRPVCP